MTIENWYVGVKVEFLNMLGNQKAMRGPEKGETL
jgi:hypothetical protein